MDGYSRRLLQDLVDSTWSQTDRSRLQAEGSVAAADSKNCQVKDKSFSAILTGLDGDVKKFLADVAVRASGRKDILSVPSSEVSADILDIIPSSVLDDKSKGTLRVLSSLGDMLLKQIKHSVVNLQHPFLINIGLLRLYMLQSSISQCTKSRAIDSGLTEHFLAEAKHYLRYAADVYQESPYISSEDILLNNLQEQFSDLSKNVKIPRHIVFLDHLTNSIVVSIRGTGSVSDVLTDLHFDAVPLFDSTAVNGALGLFDQLAGQDLSRVFAHRGMTHSATALKAPILKAIQAGRTIRGGKFKNYNVVFTGHSLGAGTACLLATLISRDADFAVKTFAFAPPPVISREVLSYKRPYLSGDKSKCTIYSFINDKDVVTRASHNEFLNLLSAVACIDSLQWTPRDRIIRLMQGYLSPEEVAEVHVAIHNSRNTNLRLENAGVELLIPGKIFWMVPKVNSSIEKSYTIETIRKDQDSLAYEVVSVDDPSALFNGSFLTGDSMISDHSVASYMSSMVNLDTSACRNS